MTSDLTTATAVPGPTGFRQTFRRARRLQRDPLPTFLALQREYGDAIYLNLGRLQLMLLCHPDHVQHILRDNYRSYRKGVFNAPLEPLLGTGLLTSEGDYWLSQRRLAQPAFHKQRLAGLVELMSQSVRPVLDRWRAAAASGQPHNLAPDMNQLTLDIVGNALFGTDTQHMASVWREAFAIALSHIDYHSTHPFALPDWVPTRRNRRYQQAVRQLDAAVYEIIAARRSRPNGHHDLLAMLLEARDAETGIGMNDQQLRDEVMTFILAGHETTAHGLAWSLALLARHRAAAKKLRAELDDVLNGRLPTLDDLPQLPYTRMVLDESLRLYPPSVIIPRQANKDDIVAGWAVPADTAVLLSQYVTHRHPDFWPDPERFDPERFSPAKVKARHRFAYLPFGAGPRICIGQQFALMEGQLILASVAQAFDWELVNGEFPELETAVTLRPRGGLSLLLHNRQ